MSYQIWCVWDFMLLTKSIQSDLQGHSAFWLPSANPLALRCINAILEEEEADHIGGFVGSHFELFLVAMAQAGAPRAQADAFCDGLRAGLDVIGAMSRAGAPTCAQSFVQSTLAFTRSPLMARAAILLHSREDLVPQMLMRFSKAAIAGNPDFSAFVSYIERHILLDSGKHVAMSSKLYDALYTREGEEQALAAAAKAIETRIQYLDAIAKELGV